MNIIARILFLAVLLNYSTACTQQSDKKENTTLKIPVVEVVQESIPYIQEYITHIEAKQHVSLYARVEGYLDRIYVDEGKEVKKGQLLFKINDGEYVAALAKAKASLTYAIAEAKENELELDRIRSLVDKQVLSKSELEVAIARYDAAKAKIEEAKSAVSNANITLGQTSIYAPFDGIIDRIPYKTGSLINQGTELTHISDLREIYAYFKFSEKEYLQYVKRKQSQKQADIKVNLILADGMEYGEEGIIETMESQFEESTGAISFRSKFPNPQKILKQGSTGTIILTSTLANAILIPQKACFDIQDKSFVYVVDKDSLVKIKSFVPKARFQDYYIVESGLKPGDRLVFEGIQSVKEGMKIIPTFQEGIKDSSLTQKQ
jgi:membrane fusion protein (multidrug efflux system)